MTEPDIKAQRALRRQERLGADDELLAIAEAVRGQTRDGSTDSVPHHHPRILLHHHRRIHLLHRPYLILHTDTRCHI